MTYEWRGVFHNDELNALHAEGFGHDLFDDDWVRQVERHSLGWVCARTADGQMVGFVNVPWDGGTHAFILDTLVLSSMRRQGIGQRLVEAATDGARAAKCAWLHVDFEDHLAPFYFDRCGFKGTPAGLIEL